MRKTLLYVLIFLGVTTQAQVITIKQDGTGDFTTIQEGIDAAVDGDSILVWPGTYVENVDFLEKSLCLGSLTMTTGDMSYIHQTIIDGNHTGGCIKIKYLQDSAEVNGFTLINGIGSWAGFISGGGIYVRNSDVDLKNCIITNNSVSGYGGGIYSKNSNLFLSNCTIFNNHAYNKGGGITIQGGTVVFDSIQRCNIYLNYAATGADFYKGLTPPVHLYLDTCTVLYPDHYYLFSREGFGYPLDDITYSVNTGKILQVSQDLYVSPEGNNNNSGLTPEEPLKNISYALLKMASDSIQPDTIHLTDGYYAPSTGEKLPLNLKSNVSIIGESRDSTILDGEDLIYILQGNYTTDNYLLKNMTLQHGHGDNNSPYGVGAFRIAENHHAAFENLLFYSNKGITRSAGSIYKSNDYIVKNVKFYNNVGAMAFVTNTSYDPTGHPPFRADTVRVINCVFEENIPDYTIEHGYGGGMKVSGDFYRPDSMTCYIMNCEFSKNFSKTGIAGSPNFSSLLTDEGSKTYLINSTIAYNDSENTIGATIGTRYSATLNVYNSIIFGNYPAQFFMESPDGNSYLNIYNYLIQDGQYGIKIYSGNTHLHYDPTNINADPLWDTAGPYPYMLTAGSPCINTGTLNLPEGIELPDTDILGYPRVWDGGIDMGAYEYGPWVGIDYQEPTPPKPQISANPNPFYHEILIKYQVKEKGKQTIFVYDIKGNMVATLLDITGQPGRGEFYWNGTNDLGRELKPGVYIVELVVNEESRGSVKVVKR